MSSSHPLAASAGTTFLVHCVGIALAALPAYLAGAAGDAIGGQLPGGAADLTAPGGAFLVEAIDALVDDHLFGLGAAFVAALTLSLVLSPGLHMAWLAALEGPRSTGRALGVGLRRYLPCVGLRLVLAGAGMAVTVPSVLLAVGARLLLRDVVDVRSADLLFLASLLPAGALLVALGCLWDLAHAALVRADRGVLDALRHGLVALRPRAFGPYLGFAALGTLLLGGAHLVSFALPTHGAAWVFGALASSQLLLLGRTFVRAAWLAAAVERTAR